MPRLYSTKPRSSKLSFCLLKTVQRVAMGQHPLNKLCARAGTISPPPTSIKPAEISLNCTVHQESIMCTRWLRTIWYCWVTWPWSPPVLAVTSPLYHLFFPGHNQTSHQTKATALRLAAKNQNTSLLKNYLNKLWIWRLTLFPLLKTPYSCNI